MPQLSITKTYQDTQILDEADLDAMADSIEEFVNTTKLDGDNIQDGAIGTDQLAVNSITSDKVASGAIITSTIADASITTAKISDLSITTTKISDGAITRAKLAAVGQQISSSCGSFSTGNTSYTDVTNLTITITTTGRPVWLALVGDGSGSLSDIRGPTENSFRLLRDATTVCEGASSGNGSVNLATPPPFLIVDTPSIGTYVYKVQAKVVSSGSVALNNMKLLAFEF